MEDKAEMEDALREMQNQIQGLKVVNKEEYSFTVECERDGCWVSLKSNGFYNEGFANFAIFETGRRLDCNELRICDEDRLRSKYKNSIEEDIGELIEVTESDCKKYKVRTVIHCLNKDLLEMFNELLPMHLTIHNKAFS